MSVAMSVALALAVAVAAVELLQYLNRFFYHRDSVMISGLQLQRQLQLQFQFQLAAVYEMLTGCNWSLFIVFPVSSSSTSSVLLLQIRAKCT